MRTDFLYPVVLIPEADGGFSVSFPDFPEAFSGGDDMADALTQAADCLDEAIAGRIAMREDIPSPSPARGRHRVSATALIAAKASLYLAMRAARVTQVNLADRLQVDHKEVRRLLDPRHNSRIDAIERAVTALGYRLVVACDAVPDERAAAKRRAAAAKQNAARLHRERSRRGARVRRR